MDKKITNPKVSAVFDYIVKVEGKHDYQQRKVFYLEDNKNIKLFLINAAEDQAYLISNANPGEIQIGASIIEDDEKQTVFSSKDHFGRIIDIHGNAYYPKKVDIKQKAGDLERPIFGLAHNLMTVKKLNEQLYTGITVVDLLIPIGKGQRELIIGDRQTGKTHIAINTIINAARKNVKCVYVAIGQKRENITSIYNNLTKYDAMKNTIIIDAPATSVYEQYLAPYVGMAHAENISANDDVLIVFDDLTKHANIFREIALLTDKPVGKEAMPGDMFFAHSSLLERAGSFVNRKTITALPILQTIDGDITSLISSNIISITDGQIVTSADLFSAGKFPAINVDLSVSRTGSSVQNRLLTKAAGEIGKIFRAYKRHLKLAMLDYELNKETSILLYKGKMIEKMFNQVGFSLHSENLTIFMTKIISWGILRNIKDEQKALKFLDALLEINLEAKGIFEHIRKNEKYDDKISKNFFAYSLKQYSDFMNLDWKVEYEHGFVPFSTETLELIAKRIGDK
ncbi:ATP F0F1 synthase subunit alpha [Mycoplasma phocoeninasale]|uniref:ATP F0F1 synthase subunit alpha n=1 Tax=Mycoplasma phocoeninasale TaxID=2726117 RepID=A0A858U632_9MOLU|nr:ATP F0F1 synthase subunit alpha [Mycoplasma phocoeninasale]QJG66258.1 ATP F0F1 synthase subunit alpha [Mycoplasma phocoeninasale]